MCVCVGSSNSHLLLGKTKKKRFLLFFSSNYLENLLIYWATTKFNINIYCNKNRRKKKIEKREREREQKKKRSRRRRRSTWNIWERKKPFGSGKKSESKNFSFVFLFSEEDDEEKEEEVLKCAHKNRNKKHYLFINLMEINPFLYMYKKLTSNKTIYFKNCKKESINHITYWRRWINSPMNICIFEKSKVIKDYIFGK